MMIDRQNALTIESFIHDFRNGIHILENGLNLIAEVVGRHANGSKCKNGQVSAAPLRSGAVDAASVCPDLLVPESKQEKQNVQMQIYNNKEYYETTSIKQKRCSHFIIVGACCFSQSIIETQANRNIRQSNNWYIPCLGKVKRKEAVHHRCACVYKYIFVTMNSENDIQMDIHSDCVTKGVFAQISSHITNSSQFTKFKQQLISSIGKAATESICLAVDEATKETLNQRFINQRMELNKVNEMEARLRRLAQEVEIAKMNLNRSTLESQPKTCTVNNV